MTTPKAAVLEEASLAEFVGAKVHATGRKIETWLETGHNMDKTLLAASAGFSALSAGAEIAANVLGENDGVKGRLQRGALHAAATLSLASAGASLFLEGSWSGYNRGAKEASSSRPRR
jgi:hypothetical protein